MIEEYQGVWYSLSRMTAKLKAFHLGCLDRKELADKLVLNLGGVLLGEVQRPASEVIAYGVISSILLIILSLKTTDWKLHEIMNQLVETYKPEIYYTGNAERKDLASAVATDLATGLTADTTMLDIDLKPTA